MAYTKTTTEKISYRKEQLKTLITQYRTSIQETFYLSLIIVTFFAFHTEMENLIKESSKLKTLLFNFKGSIYIEIVGYGYVVFILIKAFVYFPKKQTYFSIVLSLLISSMYFYYRIKEPVWSFQLTAFWNILAYTDFLAASFIIQFLNGSFSYLFLLKRSISNKSKSSNNKEHYLIEDLPIKDNKSDDLGYQVYAENISTKIINTTSKQSFAIGVNAPWGTGKTSFITLVEDYLKNSNIEIVHFNPWKSKSPDLLIFDFFNVLYSHFSLTNSKLSRSLIEYSEALVNSFTSLPLSKQVFKTLRGKDKKSYEELYQDIKNELEFLRQKLVVFIDDTDRLSHQEIFEIIRLVRNTANFPNTFFIVTYDKDYLSSAIATINNANSYNYLEKIIQLEISLPQIKPYFLTDRLFINISKFLEDQEQIRSLKELFAESIYDDRNIYNWLKNMRDVTRLSNSLMMNYHNLKGDVYFPDFLFLEILRLNYPHIHSYIYRSRKLVFSLESAQRGKVYYKLKTKGKRESPSAYTPSDPSEVNIGSVLLSKDDFNLSETECEKVISLLIQVFHSVDSFHNDNFHAAKYERNFEKYFTYAIDDNEISYDEFNRFKELPHGEQQQKILQWIDKGLVKDLHQRLSSYNETFKSPDFSNVLKSIFFFANQIIIDRDQPIYRQKEFIPFDPTTLISILFYQNEYYIAKLDENQTLYEENSNFRSLIDTLFKHSNPPFHPECGLIRYFIRNQHMRYLPLEYLREVSILYVDSYLQVTKSFNIYTWYIVNTAIQCCEKANKTKEELTRKIKAYASENLHDFLVSSTVRYEVRLDFLGCYLSPDVNVLFENHDFFRSWLETQQDKHPEMIDEYLRFFDFLKSAASVNYVMFEFEHLDIEKRTRESETYFLPRYRFINN